MEEESNLVSFAKKELDAIGMLETDESEMNRMMRENILEMVTVFSNQNHSGFSAGYLKSAIDKLLDWKPLAPLSGDDSEWIDVSEFTSNMKVVKLYQNNRCASVFKEVRDDGVVNCYNIDGKVFVEPDGQGYTNVNSRVDVTFPYTPSTEYVKREKEEE